MKNLKLLLLIIASISLLNSCGETKQAEKIVSSAPTDASNSITQPTIQSKPIASSELIERYKKSQTELITSLKARTESNKSGNVKDKLINFRKIIEDIKTETSDINIKNKIDTFGKLIKFESLNTGQDLSDLQKELVILGKNLGDEQDKSFGSKTSTALIGEIEKFGTELQSPKADSKVLIKTPAPTEEPKSPEPGFSWLDAIAPVLSLLSMIASGFAVYMAIDKTKKVKYRTANEIDKLRNSFDSEINAFRSKNQQLESNYANLSHRLDRLDRLSQQQPSSYSPPPSYPQERKTDDYRNDFNPNQNSTPIQSSTPRKNLPPAQPSFINEYNQNSGNFYTKYVTTEVLEEQYNIEGRRSGKVKTVNLSPAPKRTGGYWVFSQDNQYLLVPSSDVRINKFSLNTVDAMFDYSDFNSSYQKIRLVRPAIVEQNASGYQLVQRGRIEFE